MSISDKVMCIIEGLLVILCGICEIFEVHNLLSSTVQCSTALYSLGAMVYFALRHKQ